MDLRDKVTIGVPVYNEARFIRNTLESVVVQGASVLVSDNASLDGTEDICKEYADRGLISYVRQERNIGSWANFLFLANRAATPYFMWIGGHDQISENYVSVLSRRLDENPTAALAYPNTYSILDEDNVAYNSVVASNAVTSFFRASDVPCLRYFFFAAIGKACPYPIYGLFRLQLLRDVLENHAEPFCAADRAMLESIILKGKILREDNVKYFFRISSGTKLQDQGLDECRKMVGDVNAGREALLDYTKKGYDNELKVLESAKLPSLVSRFLRRRIKRRFEPLFMRSLYEDATKFVNDGMNGYEYLEKVEALAGELDIFMSPAVVWDQLTLACLGEYVLKVSKGEMTWLEYRAKAAHYVSRGLKIPYSRRARWFLRYRCKLL